MYLHNVIQNNNKAQGKKLETFVKDVIIGDQLQDAF